MFKAAADLMKPDPRYAGMIYREHETGDQRPAAIEDLHALVVSLELGSGVPTPVREQFDKARNAFVYSWFTYDMATLAEQQAYAVLEMAIREKIRSDGAEPPRNLRPLLKEADKRGWLGNDAAFLIEALPHMRNELAHGSSHLNPYGSLDMIRLCARLVDQLFAT
jgi:hypothetical protein